MDDASCIPVIDYSTPWIKIDGIVTRLVNSLHVLGLNGDLFLVTNYGRMDYGHSFILECGNMHLSFPTFTILQPIPERNDLRVSLQPMSTDNWIIPIYILGGNNCS